MPNWPSLSMSPARCPAAGIAEGRIHSSSVITGAFHGASFAMCTSLLASSATAWPSIPAT